MTFEKEGDKIFMAVKIEKRSGCVIATLDGDIDHHTAKNIRESIDSEVEKTKPKILKLDFNKVNFMDSSGIGLIMGRYKLMKLLNGDLELINVSQRIGKIMRLSGIYKLKKH